MQLFLLFGSSVLIKHLAIGRLLNTRLLELFLFELLANHVISVVGFFERSKIRLLIAWHDHGHIKCAERIQKQNLNLRVMLDVQVVGLRIDGFVLTQAVEFPDGRQRLLQLVYGILLFAYDVFEQ